jgi:hypothetical protein
MQIEQNPRDYRAKPVRGEPIFHPGGLKRLAGFALWLVIGLAAAALTYPIYLLSCNFITMTCR